MAGRMPAISLYAAGPNPSWFHRVSTDFDARASGAVLSRDTKQVHRAQIVDYMHDCAYTVRSMADDAEWDPRKAAANLKNHGVDFADAVSRPGR